jgi:hypothetical protein
MRSINVRTSSLRRNTKKMKHTTDLDRYFGVVLRITAFFMITSWTTASNVNAAGTKRDCFKLLKQYILKLRLDPDSGNFDKALEWCRKGDTGRAINVFDSEQKTRLLPPPRIVSLWKIL